MVEHGRPNGLKNVIYWKRQKPGARSTSSFGEKCRIRKVKRHMKKLFKVFMLLSFLLLTSTPSSAWWLWVHGVPVQEGTQLGRLAASIKEIAEQLEMIKQHLAMLKSLKAKLMNELGIGQIMEIFAQTQEILQQAKSLTSDIKDFGKAFAEHYPDFKPDEIVNALTEGKRMDDTWREKTEGYLKTLNMTAKEFENEQKARDRMMQTLTEADPESGQTKAIQVIGAMVNHAAFLLDRNNQELSGFMESYATRKQMERERKKIVKQNMINMSRNASSVKPSGKRFKPGF